MNVEIELVDPGALINFPGDDPIELKKGEYELFFILKITNAKGHIAARLSYNACMVKDINHND